jgi:predicted nucleic acid-binding protein
VIPWIIDASITINWLLDDEQDRQHSIAIFQCIGERKISVPSLWVYEVANVLLVAHRRKRLTADKIQHFLKTLSELEPQLHAPELGSASRLSKLALQHQLTVYDAAYLDLALHTGFPIATINAALIRAMKAAKVERAMPSASPIQ